MKPESLSEELQAYLADWLAWAEAGGQDGPYRPYWGLCGNAPNIEVRRELEYLFEEVQYPFGQEAYHKRQSEDSLHLDPVRLAWVRNQLARQL